MTLTDLRLFQYVKKNDTKLASHIESVFNATKDTIDAIAGCYNNYTMHNTGHSLRVANYMGELACGIEDMFDENIKKYNAFEVTLMILAALLHDIGMFIRPEDRERITQNDIPYTNSLTFDGVMSVVNNDAEEAIKEIVRITHAHRIKEYINYEFGDKTISSILRLEDKYGYADDVVDICVGHGEDYDYLKKLRKQCTKGQYTYNLQFISVLLRIADYLDLDSQRTPVLWYKMMRIDGFSKEEWEKHFVVHNERKLRRYIANELQIFFEGKSSNAKIHRKYLAYVDAIRAELERADELLNQTNTEESSACAMSSSVDSEIGKTYTFSAYVKTVGTQAKLGIEAGGEIVYSQPIAPNTDWTRLEVSCEAVSGSYVSAYVITENIGYTYVDCVQLETAPTASRYNLIQNGDFRNGLNGWTGTAYIAGTSTIQAEDGTEKPYAAAPQLDYNVASVTGEYNAEKALSQTVNVIGDEGDTLVLTGWARADSVAIGREFHDQERTFQLNGVFNYSDGTTSDPFPVEFNHDAGSTVRWQYSAAPMVAERAFNSVTVSISYDYNMNTAMFDGIGLYLEEFGSSYTYDADGNLISVVDLEKQETSYEYDSDNNLTQIIEGDKVKMSYEYDDWHNVTKATTQQGQVYDFAYDVYGNNTSVSITADGLTMASSATYSEHGNYLVSTTDAMGKTTTYEYNPDTGLLTSVKYPDDPEWAKTTYTYDEMYRQAKAAAAVGTGEDDKLSAEYTYTDDRLTAVKTPTTTYNFTYGDFGLRESVKVGTRELASYEYTNDRNKYLSAIRYGNGEYEEYTYDSKGRLITRSYCGCDNSVTYQYDNNGALATVTDSITGITTKYYYDFTDRLLAYEESGTSHSLNVGYTYDTHNNLTGLKQTVNGAAHTAVYTYDDDNRITSMTADGVTVEYTYDGFGRVIQQVTKKENATILTESFTYTTKDGKTSAQIATYTTATADENGNTVYTKTYTYTYDSKGNILSVSEGGKTITYTYDSQNQLIREDNKISGYVHEWTYDNAGNIEEHRKFAYTESGSLVSDGSPIEYEYNNEEWGDLLTAYDGISINCDSIGNAESMGGLSFTWVFGRLLVAISTDTQLWDMLYNADGLRIKRTESEGATYNYIYNGSTLTQMTFGADTLFFNYDAAGVPLTVTYNGVTYYYATNLQGDIVAILDSTGASVVSYTYDAWGNHLSISGTMAATLGQLNPLRYRGYVYDVETGLYYLQSRYYNPEIGRFINADGYTSTGQGFTGNNMFAYCGNNPILFSDYGGTRYCAAPTVGGESASDRKTSCDWQKQQVLPEKKQTPLDEWEEEGVVFIPSGSGNGGEIKNSHLITDIAEMNAYASYLMYESEYASYFSGSIEGFVFEWESHNIAYFYYKKNGKEEKAEAAAHLNVGRTIYDDSHGAATWAMLLAYNKIYPDQARRDWLIHISLTN